MKNIKIYILLPLVWVIFIGCGGADDESVVAGSNAQSGGWDDDDYSDSMRDDDDDETWDDDDYIGDDDDAVAADDDDDGQDYLPPEIEEKFMTDAPVASLSFVYILNKNLGAVARIDPEDLKVHSISVGSGARALVAIPGADAVVAAITGKRSVAYIDSSSGIDELIYVKLSEPYTDLKVSPDGNFVIAYFNLGADAEIPEDITGSNYAKVAVIDMQKIISAGEFTADAVDEKPVSFRTTDVFFSSDSKTAFIATKSDVSIIQLSGASVGALPVRVALGDNAYTDVSTREILITPDGQYIFVRNFFDNRIMVIDAETKDKTYIILDGVASDMDISPTGEYMLVVERAAKTVAIIPLPGGILDETEIKKIEFEDVVVGQSKISPVENIAVMFTTAEYREEILIVDLETGEYNPYGHGDGLEKAVKSASFSPDGERLVIFHYPRPSYLNYTYCDVQTAPCSASQGECYIISGTKGVCLKECDPAAEEDECADYYYCYEAEEDEGICVRNGDLPENIEVSDYEIQVNQKEGYSIFNIESPFFWTKLLENEVSSYAFTQSSKYAGFVLTSNGSNASASSKDILQIARLDAMIVADDVALPSPALFTGAFPESEMIFVLQDHPVGRISFVDIDAGDVRTVTGFELNSEIE